jgi:hypothetical protein
MRVSEYFGLARAQPDLDFVEVDIWGDIPIFVDPRALRVLPSQWASDCKSLAQNFFHTVLDAIRKGRHDDARWLLRRLREPNETHLGYSRQKARGHALGPESAAGVWDALSRSEAVKSGLLEDLEDTILMVEGIGPDIVSDITTNVIREPLIHYTQYVCSMYDIPMRNNVDSGPLWDPKRRAWKSEFVALPVTSRGKLLLVPKSIVRRHMDYDLNEYYRHYLLEHLAEVEISANTELVILLKDGRKKVYIRDLKEKYGEGKCAVVEITRQYPDVLERYRDAKKAHVAPPLDHSELAETTGTDMPDWKALLHEVTKIRPGPHDADRYHRAVERLLTSLFYPALSSPELEYRIHQGRKRIDIKYVNAATGGFFGWLSWNYPAPHVFVECKNYKGDPANPELDQLAGRFSPSRGKFGLLVCREFKDKPLFVQRCRDTAQDQRGFIIALDDGDLESLVEGLQPDAPPEKFDLLRKRFEELTM